MGPQKDEAALRKRELQVNIVRSLDMEVFLLQLLVRVLENKKSVDTFTDNKVKSTQ